MFQLNKKYLNTEQKTILCIPDVKASWHFISKTYELHLNLILVLEESWLKSVDCSGALELVVVSDFTSTIEIITQVDKIIERLEYSVSIDYVVAFTEQHIELIGILTDYYGAHSISSTQAQLFRDKYVMKQRAKEMGASQQ
ncbi:hypothetical protein NIES4106_56450 (plasmid) [Fischerella sp. NIES-4106]|nr:hypothetical protein NIES4106_56450 [Fischerella sp. NIES-4106]